MTLGHRALAARLGRTACIDSDDILGMVDPKWELSEEEHDFELAGWQTWLLAKSFLTRGFECVIIGGNGLHTPEAGLNDQITFLLSVGDVYHVTLDPSLEEIQRRVVERGSDMTPESVAHHVAWM